MSIDSLAELIRKAIDSRTLDLHTALPAKVVLYNPATVTIQAQPVITRPVEVEDNPLLKFMYEILPVLHDVPVCFPRGGSTSITWPISTGDHVLIIFSEADISQWAITGQLANPDYIRRHGLQGGLALPCLGSQIEPLPSAVIPGLVVTAGDIRLGSLTATEFATKSASLIAALDAAIAAGIAAAVPNDGGAAALTALQSSWNGAKAGTAATKVKVE